MNVIVNDNTDELIGYAPDIFNYLKDEYIKEIEGDNFSVISPEWLELLEDSKKYIDTYGGLLIVSENNGMGWTIQPYRGEK